MIQFHSGVSPDSTDKQIGAAYKLLSLKFHPDRNPNDEVAAAKFKAVHEAYQVLSDPQRRKEYDMKDEMKQPSSTETSSDEEGGPLGGIQKALGGIINVSTNLISRFSTSTQTQISPEIITTAQTICR